MKLFKLKRKNIILVSLLAIAGFLGISSVAVNTAANKETPVAEKADATSTTLPFSFLYFKSHNDNFWYGTTAHAYIHGSGGGEYLGMTYVMDEGNFKIWKVDISSYASNKKTQVHFSNDINFATSDATLNVNSENNFFYMDNGGDKSTSSSSYVYTLTIVPVLNGTTQTSQTQEVLRGERANPTQPTGYTSYTFGGWYSNSGCTTSWTSGTRIDENTTLYAKYTTASYDLTYKYYNISGSTIKTATVTSTAYGSTVTLPNTSITGYRLKTWHEGDGLSGTNRAVGYQFTMPNSATTYTAEYDTVGAYLLGIGNDWTITLGKIMSDYGETNYVYKNISLTAGNTFKVHYIPASGDYTWHGWGAFNTAGGKTDANSDFKEGASNDNIECKTTGVYDIILNTSTGKVFAYRKGSGTIDAGYYMVGTGTFASGTTPTWALANGILMSAGTSGNTAQLESVSGTSVAANSTFKVVNHASASSNTWYSMTLGGSYDFASVSNGEVTITKAGSYNFYFKMDNFVNYIYIVDIGQIDSFGFLYIASNKAAGNITFTSKLADGTSIYSGNLSDISGLETISNVSSFDGASHLYKIKIYNMRGTQGGALVTQFTWNDGSSKTITGIPTAATTAPSYYGSNGAASTSKGDAAKAVFDVGSAIKSSTNKSVCDLSESAHSLLSECTVTGIDTTLLNNATITTWNSVAPTYSGSKDWSMTEIIAQLNRLDSTSSSAYRNFSLFGSEDNFSTIIIIISSSVALLSVTALSILVIRKRKSKED